MLFCKSALALNFDILYYQFTYHIFLQLYVDSDNSVDYILTLNYNESLSTKYSGVFGKF